MNSKPSQWPQLMGTVLVNTAVQASLGSLELPNRVIIRNFITTQNALDSFGKEIQGYLLIGGLWAIGSTMLMYVMHQPLGAIINLFFQMAAMLWIIYRRYDVLAENADKYKLHLKSMLSMVLDMF